MKKTKLMPTQLEIRQWKENSLSSQYKKKKKSSNASHNLMLSAGQVKTRATSGWTTMTELCSLLDS
jgi:hypothetical protein